MAGQNAALILALLIGVSLGALGKPASRSVFNDSHIIAHLCNSEGSDGGLVVTLRAPPQRKHRVWRDLHERRGTRTGGRHSTGHRLRRP